MGHPVALSPGGRGYNSPPNVYMMNTGLVPGITGRYNARWCQRAVYESVLCPLAWDLGFLMNYCIHFHVFWGN